MNKSSKRILKKLGWFLLAVFIFMNVIAAFHAYKFTHFADVKKKKPEPKNMTFPEKLSALFFGVDMPRPITSKLPGFPFETIRIKSNKVLETWLISIPDPKGVVIIFHGYGGEKSSMLDKAEVFHQLGYSTMLVDFMGAGGSEGNQTTIGFREAEEVNSCIGYLKEKKFENIILFGTSLGAAAIMKAVKDYHPPVSSVILECPFGSMMETVKSRFHTMGVPVFPMVHLLMFWGGVINGFNAFEHNPADYAKKINCPVLLFYGEKDIKVSRAETDRIFNNLGGAKKLVTFPLAGHENYLGKYRTEWTKQVSDFLLRH